MLELSGLFGGGCNSSSRFSSSAMRASAAFNWATSERMRASVSACDSLLRSRSVFTPTLNRVARYRVNLHFRRAITKDWRGGLSRYRECAQMHNMIYTVTFCRIDKRFALYE